MNKAINQQVQIDELNRKLDLVLDYLNTRQQKSAVTEDLLADLSLIGKDMYDTSVTELENRLVEIDPDHLRELMIKLLKNIPTFVRMIDTIESLTDLVKDAGPMINEMIIDLTKKLHEFEQKGYFTVLRRTGIAIDNAVKVLNSMETETIPEYSFWKLLKEIRSPEMRRVMTFMVIFMKNFAKKG